MADIGAATITLPYERFKEIESQYRAARADAETLRRELAAATRPEGMAEVEPFVMAALEIVQYAVGNLNPESNRGWPVGALRRVADNLAELAPNYPGDIDSLVITLRAFAREVDDVDRTRDERIEAAKQFVENS